MHQQPGIMMGAGTIQSVGCARQQQFPQQQQAQQGPTVKQLGIDYIAYLV